MVRRLVIMGSISAVVGMGCSDAPPRRDSTSGYERQLAVVEEQNQRYQKQLEKADESLERAEEQDRRFDAILDKWEEQVRRYDAILDRWERMLPPGMENKTNSKEGT